MTTGRINQVFPNPCGDLGPRFGTRADGEMAWALVSGATFWRFNSSPVPWRADVLETGDIGGDWFSGLPCYVATLAEMNTLFFQQTIPNLREETSI